MFQFRKTENSWRLDRSHRGGDRCDTPCLVDAADVRTVNALKTSPGVVNECFYEKVIKVKADVAALLNLFPTFGIDVRW